MAACREAGYTRKDAQAIAWYALGLQYPRPEPKVMEHACSISSNEASEVVQVISGLSELPAHWPQDLPGSVDLATEVRWANANRLRCRIDATTMDLNKALTAAPSWGAISWIEVAQLFPAKFIDAVQRATAQATDEGGWKRAERRSIEDVRQILEQLRS